MRHRRRHSRLHRSKGAHDSLLRHLSQSVLAHGRIKTTLGKAREARRHIDHLITLGKEGTLQARRRASQMLGKEESLRTLFNEVAPLFKKRQGGYTRVIRTWTRLGDGAQLAILELTEQRPVRPKETRIKETPLPKTPEAKPSPRSEVKGRRESPAPEKQKPSGFLGSLRRFLKPKDRTP